MKRIRRFAIFLSLFLAVLDAQSPTPKAMAPVDLTGYWVSVVTEDWLYRMVTPKKGDFTSVGRQMITIRAGETTKDVIVDCLTKVAGP